MLRAGARCIPITDPEISTRLKCRGTKEVTKWNDRNNPEGCSCFLFHRPFLNVFIYQSEREGKRVPLVLLQCHPIQIDSGYRIAQYWSLPQRLSVAWCSCIPTSLPWWLFALVLQLRTMTCRARLLCGKSASGRANNPQAPASMNHFRIYQNGDTLNLQEKVMTIELCDQMFPSTVSTSSRELCLSTRNTFWKETCSSTGALRKCRKDKGTTSSE